jgi:hypothetical protein
MSFPPKEERSLYPRSSTRMQIMFGLFSPLMVERQESVRIDAQSRRKKIIISIMYFLRPKGKD